MCKKLILEFIIKTNSSRGGTLLAKAVRLTQLLTLWHLTSAARVLSLESAGKSVYGHLIGQIGCLRVLLFLPTVRREKCIDMTDFEKLLSSVFQC